MNKFNELSQTEGFDRVYCIVAMLEDQLGHISIESNGKLKYNADEIHPSIYDDKAKTLLANASSALSDLYQHIGQWGVEVVEPEVEYNGEVTAWHKKEIDKAFDKEDGVFYTEEQSQQLMEDFKKEMRDKSIDK